MTQPSGVAPVPQGTLSSFMVQGLLLGPANIVVFVGTIRFKSGDLDFDPRQAITCAFATYGNIEQLKG
jgi:hypothetical protein